MNIQPAKWLPDHMSIADQFDAEMYVQLTTPALADINEQIADLERKLGGLRERRNNIITRAKNNGISPTRLSRLTGLSRQTIYEVSR